MNKHNKFTLLNQLILTTFISLLSSVALAQLAVVNPTSDWLSRVQHVARYAQAAESYSKQVLQYQNQLLQYEAMLKNLKSNPLAIVAPNMDELVNNSAKLMASGRSIGNNMSTISDDISKVFTNPQGDFGAKFRVWTTASSNALKGAMLNAGLHRENFANDTAALKALVTKNTASEGALAATKTLGEINTAQLMESIKLREMISSQQLAVNSYMMSQEHKDQAKQDAQTVRFSVPPLPPANTYKNPKF